MSPEMSVEDSRIVVKLLPEEKRKEHKTAIFNTTVANVYIRDLTSNTAFKKESWKVSAITALAGFLPLEFASRLVNKAIKGENDTGIRITRKKGYKDHIYRLVEEIKENIKS